MTTIPVLDWIIVRIERKVNPTTGLVLPFKQDGGMREVTVHAVGDGRPSEYSGAVIHYANGTASPVRVGDRLLIPSGAGAGLEEEAGEVRYRWIRPGDVLGIIPPDDGAGTADLAPVKVAA